MRIRRLALALAFVLLSAAGCTTGGTSATDAGSDAATDGGFAFPCGDMQCAPSQICTLAAIPTDGGAPPACGELPESCGGAPTCLCLKTSCALITGAVCQSGFEVGLVYCWR